MLKPIIENEHLSIGNVFDFFISKLNRVIKFSGWAIIVFTIYFFVRTPVYVSNVSFYTNYQEDIQSSLLSMVPSFLSGGIGSNSLDFSVSNYINSDKFALEIVNKKYLIDKEYVTLVDKWGPDYNNFLVLNPLSLVSKINTYSMYSNNLSEEDKKAFFAAKILKNSLQYSEDRKTSLHSISLTIKKDPLLGAYVMDNIYKSIVSYSNEIVNKKATEKREFITFRLSEVKSELEQLENELLHFIEENKGNK